MPQWNPGQLRHNFLTEMERKHGIVVASALVGHASIRTTEVYVERNILLADKITGEG